MSFSLKLNVHTSNMPGACSLCNLMLERINFLQENYKNIEEVEIQLYESVKEKLKGATLSIKTATDTIVESSNSKNWEDAVASVYENICTYFKIPSFREG